jgi:hypothetical protein
MGEIISYVPHRTICSRLVTIVSRLLSAIRYAIASEATPTGVLC